MTEDICPSGWHIPSDGEFTQLIDFLGGKSVAGGKMKEADYDHWNYPNSGATNSSGFTAFAGGGRGIGLIWGKSIFFDSVPVENQGYWWSTSTSRHQSLLYSLRLDSRGIYGINFNRDHGFSARCVRD